MGAGVTGVDGCSVGWVVVLYDLTIKRRVARVVPDFATGLALPGAPIVLAVDIHRAARRCDRGRSCL
jgi:predicted RNase H-like nuclease